MSLKVIQKIGSGKFSTVWHSIYEEQECALKLLKIRYTNSSVLKYEKMVLKNRNSPYFLKYYGEVVYQNRKGICMELAGCDLYFLISMYSKRRWIMPNKLVINMTKDILYALQELEQDKIIHTDLKPENILLSKNLKDKPFITLNTKRYLTKFRKIINNGDILNELSHKPFSNLWRQLMTEIYLRDNVFKLADFGNADLEENLHNCYNLCTRQYQPPETILKYPIMTTKYDIWSLGCVIYEMITGDILFGVNKYDSISPNSYQLGVIISIMGKFDFTFLQLCCSQLSYFTPSGAFKYEYRIKEEKSFKSLLLEYNYSVRRAEFYEKLLKPFFRYDPTKRLSAKKILKYINKLT